MLRSFTYKQKLKISKIPFKTSIKENLNNPNLVIMNNAKTDLHCLNNLYIYN